MNIRTRVSVIVLILASELSAQMLSSGSQYNLKLHDSTVIGFYETVQTSRQALEWTDLSTAVTINSAYPRGYNDGPVWKGKGITWEINGGARGSKGKFSFQIQPVLFYAQNRNFKLAPGSESSSRPFGSQFITGVDWVQRYGSSSKLYFHPGQSEVKFQSGKFIVSASTQNYSFGPSTFNPILLSHQGGGFPHIRLGSEPFSIGKKIGKIEVNYLAGILTESNYFDASSKNDHRFLNALFFGYSPSFLKNLKLGIGRVLYKQTPFFELEDLLSPIIVLEDSKREGVSEWNDTFDQLASFFIDWSFPEVGFRAYFEFAKNDFTGSLRNTLVEPEHTRGYTIGFQKDIISKSDKKISIIYEHTNLSINQAWLWRATPSFYSHHINQQGYTQSGQLIGAGIGPGGNSDFLFIKMKDRTKTLGLLFQRIEHQRDYFVRNSNPNITQSDKILNKDEHDIEYSVGGSFSKKFNIMSIFADLTLSHNFKRYHVDDATNLALMFGTTINL